ncbi:MAG: dihydropteroate synthase [Bacteroidetes bacterium]|nr:dihydropteroate synthase [Bacteroidota bacterium]
MNNFSTSTTLFSRNFSLNVGGQLLDLSIPVVMGIINATQDSFFQGSRVPEPGIAVELARKMTCEGAAILDVGAVSTRPGATEITEEEEVKRITPVVEAIRRELPEAIISVDTWRSGVARIMQKQFGIQMVNDITAGRFDPHMIATVADLGMAYVMMHMQGTPETMQESPEYQDVVDNLLQFFGERIYKLRKLGVNDMVIDPGFGFGKTAEQNFQLLRQLDAFAMLELPIMTGLSRKSMIYKSLGSNPDAAVNGTTAAHMAALLGGASILRVHDVKEAVETVKIFRQIVNRPANTV